MYNDKVKTRNPIAATIRSPKYRARVVRSKKVYSRKGKSYAKIKKDDLRVRDYAYEVKST